MRSPGLVRAASPAQHPPRRTQSNDGGRGGPSHEHVDGSIGRRPYRKQRAASSGLVAEARMTMHSDEARRGSFCRGTDDTSRPRPTDEPQRPFRTRRAIKAQSRRNQSALWHGRARRRAPTKQARCLGGRGMVDLMKTPRRSLAPHARNGGGGRPRPAAHPAPRRRMNTLAFRCVSETNALRCCSLGGRSRGPAQRRGGGRAIYPVGRRGARGRVSWILCLSWPRA